MRAVTAYYNENDPFAAAWLRNLIAMGLIAPGDVDERSITDVRAADLVGYRQVHFFAGIGGWSLAIRLAGIPDDAPVWTGSCPCQPFSVAGRGKGTDDARHLWPVMRDLVAECLPPVVLGEQVASAPGRLWLDVVRLDLEGLGYAVGAADLCAAGVGAPHIRQRIYWGGVRVANAGRECLRGEGHGAFAGAPGCVRGEAWKQWLRADARPGVAAAGGLANADRSGSGSRVALDHVDGARADADGRRRLGDPGIERLNGLHPLLRPEAPERDAGSLPETAGRGGADRLGDSRCPGLPPREREAVVGAGRWGEGGATSESGEAPAGPGWPSEAHGGWTAPDWLRCRDGRWRPVEPSHEQVVDGLPAGVVRGGGGDLLAAWSALSREDRKAVRRFRRGLDRGRQFMRVLFSPLERAAINRAGRLRGYGNAIVPQLAAEFTLAFFGDEPWAPTRLQG